MNKNEFFNDNQLTYYNDDYRFIKKIMRYDEDVHEIVTKRLFMGFTFDDANMDKWFKQAFVNRFSSRQIGFQTIERFAQEVVAVTLSHEKEMLALYVNFEKMLSNMANSTTDGTNGQETQRRDVNSTLPQDKINLDFGTFSMDYADDNQIGRQQVKGTDHTETQSQRFDPSTFKMLQHLWDGYFYEYEERCFLNIW